MKNLFIILCIGILFIASCKKKETNNTPIAIQTPTCYLQAMYRNDGTKIRYTYDSIGRIKMVANVDPSALYDSLRIDSISYNSNGTVTRYSYDNGYEYLNFKYNTDGTLAENNYYDFSGAFESKVIYTYNSSKKISKVSYPNPVNNLYLIGIRYDSRGNVSSVIEYDTSNAVTDSTIYEYDNNPGIYKNIDVDIRIALYDISTWGPDNVTKATAYSKTGVITRTDTYAYQTNGGQITNLNYSSTSKGFPGYSKTFTYSCH